MAEVDIVESAGAGYRLVWAERRYLVRLAAVPLFIKLVCQITTLFLGWEQQFLRQAIVMLPSFIADGWMLSHLVRLIFRDQRWPFRATGDSVRDMQVLQDRAQGIMRGAMVFAVIHYLAAGVATLLYAGTRSEAMRGGAGGAAPLAALAEALVLFLAVVWGFRFLWLFIPAALNFPLRRFLGGLRGFGSSWLMIGVWLMCFVPWYFVSRILLFAIGGLFGGGAAALVPAICVQVVFDTLINILATAGIAAALRRYFTLHPLP